VYPNIVIENLQDRGVGKKQKQKMRLHGIYNTFPSSKKRAKWKKQMANKNGRKSCVHS
jgi:hypothetical protein